MTSDPDRRLRSALRTLAVVAPPPGLADAALSRAGTVRRRRRAATAAMAAAAVVAVALAAVGARVALDRRDSPPATPPAPRDMVSGYVVTVQADNAQGATFRVWTFDAARRRYLPSPLLAGSVQSFSPDGSRMLVARSGSGRISDFEVVSLADAAAGRTDAARGLRWPSSLENMPLHGPPMFAPDGRTLLTSVWDSKLITGFVALDIDSGTTRVIELDGGPYRRTALIPGDFAVFWGPGGRGVALYQRADWRLGGAPSVRLFDLSGQPIRSIRLTTRVNPFLCCAFWSPDGQQLVLGYISLLDLRTGSVREMLGGEVKEFASYVAGWYDDSHLLMLHTSGAGAQPELQVLDVRAKQVVRRVPVSGPDAYRPVLALVPLSGPAPPGALVI